MSPSATESPLAVLYLEDACGTAAYATGNYDVTLSDPSQPVGIGLGRSSGYTYDMYCKMLFMTSAYKCHHDRAVDGLECIVL